MEGEESEAPAEVITIDSDSDYEEEAAPTTPDV